MRRYFNDSTPDTWETNRFEATPSHPKTLWTTLGSKL
jgi:hypothetical protein